MKWYKGRLLSNPFVRRRRVLFYSRIGHGTWMCVSKSGDEKNDLVFLNRDAEVRIRGRPDVSNGHKYFLVDDIKLVI